MGTNKTAEIAQELVRCNVVRLRLAKGFSQHELANRARMSRTYLSYVETEGRNITLGILFGLAQGLEVDPRELLRPTVEWEIDGSGSEILGDDVFGHSRKGNGHGRD